MTKKKLNSFSALVFSTNPDMMKEEEPEITDTPLPKDQKLRVHIEKKQRAAAQKAGIATN